MQVLFEKKVHFKDVDKWHVIRYKSWEKGDSQSLVMLRLQYYCQDKGAVYDVRTRPMKMEEYDREKHKKHLCEKCVKKLQSSKRTAPLIDNTPIQFGPRSI